MRRLLRWSVAAGAIGGVALGLIGPAEAKTCSDQLRVSRSSAPKARAVVQRASPSAAKFSGRVSRAAAGKANTSTRNAASPGNSRPRLDLADKSADVIQVNGDERQAEVVAHAGDDDQFTAGSLGGILPAATGMTGSAPPCRMSVGQRTFLRSALRGGGRSAPPTGARGPPGQKARDPCGARPSPGFARRSMESPDC